jgi:hypothetical protein
MRTNREYPQYSLLVPNKNQQFTALARIFPRFSLPSRLQER